MTIRFKRTVLSTKKLSSEVMVAFSLILLTLLVLVGYLFPDGLFHARGALPVVVGIVFAILLIGFLIILQIVEPVIGISREAKLIARGDLTREIHMVRQDELGELGEALNVLTKRIRENVDELKTLGETTDLLNREINNRIFILSNMMEISTKIAQHAPFDEVLDTITQKCLETRTITLLAVVLKDQVSHEFKVRSIGGKNSQELYSRGLKGTLIQLAQGLLGKAILKQEPLIVGPKSSGNPDVENFKGQFLVKNAVIAPISSKGSAYGLIIAGNDDEGVVYTDIEKELMQLVAKHVAIALLNDVLSSAIHRFEMTDTLTGLYNNAFSRQYLAQEIKSAQTSQRPCSFVLFSLDRFQEYYDTFGHIRAEQALITAAKIVKAVSGPEDKAARFGDHEFAVVMGGRNKREAIEFGKEIVRMIRETFASEKDPRERLTATAVVTENPIDGMSADELILKSGVLLSDTAEQGGDRVGFQTA